tara:strand:- start:3785 stop:4066 length:282 start_codon:yes stop_codon:yes gene_type:complete
MEIEKIKELNITFDTYRTIKIIRSKTDENYTRALNLYNEMKKFDISFDTGMCEYYWYWELDWSLKGATDQAVIHMLRHQKIDFEIDERAVEEE